MNWTKDLHILIVGLGVMGGGYAKALSKKGYTVEAISLNQDDIDYALQNGMIRAGTTWADPTFIAHADLIVCALYPQTFIDWVKQNSLHFKKGAILTDVTGVKGPIVQTVQQMLPPEVEFIAAHPMAGRERSGVLYSDDGVFRGANFIVTPTERNTEQAIAFCKQLGQELGFARICCLSPEEHDRMIAFLSQLTHCIAVTLMTCNQKEGLEQYTGDSFRDLTRIAKINDEMWSELFLLNKEALLAEMDAFAASFDAFRSLLAQGDRDGMRAMMRASAERRTLFDKPSPTAKL